MATSTFGDQSRSVIDRFLHHRSSQNAQTRFTRFPSESSLHPVIATSETKRHQINSRAGVSANSVITNIIITIAQSTLHNLRRLFQEIDEFGGDEDTRALFFCKLCVGGHNS